MILQLNIIMLSISLDKLYNQIDSIELRQKLIILLILKFDYFYNKFGF